MVGVLVFRILFSGLGAGGVWDGFWSLCFCVEIMCMCGFPDAAVSLKVTCDV